MKRPLLLFPLVFVAVLGVWMALYPVDWQNWLGFSHSAYFTTGQNYAFFSGIGPCLITALGLSTIVTGLWHAHNCHQESCFRLGKHRVNGTPWCSKHANLARPEMTDSERLDQVVQLLASMTGLLEKVVRPGD